MNIIDVMQTCTIAKHIIGAMMRKNTCQVIRKYRFNKNISFIFTFGKHDIVFGHNIILRIAIKIKTIVQIFSRYYVLGLFENINLTIGQI